ncbi:hypothetical protein EJ08DRAFT_650562 [Tothia fuscella]|uniref:Uncharacterized protein n=1 Tax=Tothia fuscella TaxID=1048955 RepID=A0A9P4NPU6_9PEZI|nr:hypothetical protein EJ08DRAFT_650562 [Tothia fuscella]
MARMSMLSLLSAVSIISSSLAIPLDVRKAQQYSVVNVDGSDSPATTSRPQTVTQTISAVVTETVSKPSTYISTVNVERSSTIETIFITVTPTATSTPSELPSTLSPSAPYTLPSYSSSTTANNATATATPSEEPCDEDEGPELPVPVGTGTVGNHAAYPTAGYLAAVAWPSGVARPTGYRPSGMTAPFPTLPLETPRWFNRTQIPHYKKRAVLN